MSFIKAIAQTDFLAKFKGHSWLDQMARLFFYKAFVSIDFETKDFRVKTADNLGSLFQALYLRFLCFVAPHASKLNPFRIDVDQYDLRADHLLIYCKKTDRLVATYRILCSHFTDKFYSESEFNLDHFLEASGAKIELGRACVHPDFRKTNLVDLLWKGIGSYSKETRANFLFGCSSVKTLDHQVATDLIHYFDRKDLMGKEYEIKTYGEQPKGLVPSVEDVDKSQVPPLLKGYFLAGAKLYGNPFFDRDFQCIDFLTILNLRNISPSFMRRYF
jgi:putative hemolysin